MGRGPLLALLLVLQPGPASAQAGCRFALGFKALAEQIPAVVGDCLEDERVNPANGDALQRTTGGLLVWRKADNWTAFTDGYRTWVNGPLGLQQRLNTERFLGGARDRESAWADSIRIAIANDYIHPVIQAPNAENHVSCLKGKPELRARSLVGRVERASG